MFAALTTYPIVFAIVGGIALGLWLAWALNVERIVARFGKRFSDGAFVVLSLLALLAFRWPTIVTERVMNPDEAQMAAQAIRMLTDPWPWHGFDGGTGGPLDSLPLVLPAFIGLPISLRSSHAIGILVDFFGILLFYFAGRRIFGDVAARAGVFVPLAFFTLMHDENFQHYSSERVPAFFALASSLAVLLMLGAKSRIRTIILSGLILGFAPFSKLQVVPIVGFLIVVELFSLAFAPHWRSHRRRSLLLFVGSLSIGTIVFGSGAAATGSLHDAYESYIATNLQYIDAGGQFDFWSFITGTAELAAFVKAFCIGLFCGFGVLLTRGSLSRASLVRLLVCVGSLAVSLYAIEKPHHPFQHYFLLAVFPCGLVAAAFFASIREAGLRLQAVLISALVALPLFALQMRVNTEYVKDLQYRTTLHDTIGAELANLIPAHASAVVWGWMPQYYIATQTAMATRDANCYYDIIPSPVRSYYRERFMRDMRMNRPSVFIDAVGPESFTFQDRKNQGFESFPELRDYVLSNYVFLADIRGVRVYARRSSDSVG
jgi:hypothetical protein